MSKNTLDYAGEIQTLKDHINQLLGMVQLYERFKMLGFETTMPAAEPPAPVMVPPMQIVPEPVDHSNGAGEVTV